MILLLRISAWLFAAAIAFATLVPIGYRPVSGAGRNVEYLLAFVVVGLVFGLAYPRHRRLAAGVSVVSIAALEMMQLLVPGRHARLEDFAIKALASCAGMAIAGLISWVVRSHWHAKP